MLIVEKEAMVVAFWKHSAPAGNGADAFQKIPCHRPSSTTKEQRPFVLTTSTRTPTTFIMSTGASGYDAKFGEFDPNALTDASQSKPPPKTDKETSHAKKEPKKTDDGDKLTPKKKDEGRMPQES